MANVCSDTVVLFPKEDTPGNAVSRLKEDLLRLLPFNGDSCRHTAGFVVGTAEYSYGRYLLSGRCCLHGH